MAIGALTLFAMASWSCAYETAPVQVGEITEIVTHPDGQVEVRTYPMIEGTPTQSEVCADGDYVAFPGDATVRAAECYNRGQKDALRLMFQYSGGTVWTSYCLEDNFEGAVDRADNDYACLVGAYLAADGSVRIVEHEGGRERPALWQTRTAPTPTAGPMCFTTNTGVWARCPRITPTPTLTPVPTPTRSEMCYHPVPRTWANCKG